MSSAPEGCPPARLYSPARTRGGRGHREPSLSVQPFPLARHAAAGRRGGIADIALFSYSLALSQPAYKRAHHVGIIIGPDALSGIRQQVRPISGLRERTEILILAHHRGDDGDPLLLARIFLNVAAVIEARNRAVCMGDAGYDGPKLEMIVRHVERYDAVWLELAQIDRHRLPGEEVYRYCSADEGIDNDQIVTGIGRVRDRQPRIALHDGNV